MVTNRVYRVLATNGTEAASVAALTAGQYVILKEDGSKLATADTITDEDFFTIVVKAPNGELVFSSRLRGKDIKQVNNGAYRARVEQVSTVTVAAPTAGQEYNLAIINTSDKEILTMRQNKRSYSVPAVVGETATTLADKFRTKINDDPASVVTASGSGASIILTADSIASTADLIGEYQSQYTFEVFLSEVNNFGYALAFGSVAATTAADPGAGNFDQVRTLEQRGQGYVGVTNRTKWPVEPGLYTTVSGVNYDVIIVEAEREYESNSATFGLVQSPVSVIIPVTSGAGVALLALINKIANA